MRSKKFLLALLSVLMMATAGVACTENTEQSSSSPPTSSSSESSSAQEENVSVKLDKTEATMHLFETLSLKAKVKGTTDAVEWTSSDPTIATVSNGVVMPVTVGTVTITASVAGEEASCAITITQHQGDIELVVPYKTLELGMGEPKNVSVSGCLGLLNDIAGGVFDYVIEDESIVTVDKETGMATPGSVGSTTITITGTFKGVPAKDSLVVTVVVSSVENKVLETAVTFRENREDKISIDLSNFNITGLTSFEMDGEIYEADFSADKKLTVSKAQFNNLAGGKKAITISGTTDAGKIFIKGEVNYINYAIANADEFKAFQKVYENKEAVIDRSSIYTYVVLERNIDLLGENLSCGGKAGKFYGVFDGQGYAIDDFNVNVNSIFYFLGNKDCDKVTEFKNVAFTNCTRKIENEGGVLATILENAILDNIYIQCDQYGAGKEGTYGFSSALADWARSGGSTKKVEIRNCFVEIETPDSTPMAGALVARAEEGCTTIENCYAVSNTAVGLYGVINNGDKSYDAVSQKANKDNFYPTLANFTKEVKAVPLGFDIELWQMRNGVLSFKGVDQTVELVEIPGKKFVANNRADALELDFDAYNAQDANILKVAVGAIPVTNYSFVDGTLQIPSSSITARGDVNVSVTLRTSSGKMVATAQAYVVDYAIGNAQEFADFQLVYATKTSEAGDRTGIYTYAVLTDNIDLAGASFEYWSNSCNFYGMFDGQGYTINNLNIVTNSLFHRIGDANYDKVTEFKNVAFTNSTRAVGTGSKQAEVGGLLAFYVENVWMENLYIQGNQFGDIPEKNNTGYMGAIADYAHNGGKDGKTVTIRNCLVEYESEGYLRMAGALVARAQQGVVTVENSYAISNTAVGLYGVYSDNHAYSSIAKLANQNNLYTSVDAFKSVVTSAAGFNSLYWEMQNGLLVFKSAYVPTATIAGEQVVANNRPDENSLKLNLSAYNVTGVTKVTIGGREIADYTYADNTLTVAFDKLPKGKLSISIATTTSTENLLVKAQAYVVDYAIGTVAELDAFRDSCAGKTTDDPYMYVALTANIDYADGEYYGEGTATGTFYGSFDGRGYTVSNVKVKHSFFPAIQGLSTAKRSMIKNFGLVNVVKHTTNGGGLLANDMSYTDVDNVYVSGSVEQYEASIIGEELKYVSGAIAGSAKQTTINNCVAEITYGKESAKLGSLVGVADHVVVNNIYAKLLGSTSYSYVAQGSIDINLNRQRMQYTDEKFTSLMTMANIPAGFDVSYWGIKDGVFTFKNA